MLVPALLLLALISSPDKDQLPDRKLADAPLSKLTPGFRIEYEVTVYGVDNAKNKQLSGHYSLSGSGTAWKESIDFPGFIAEYWYAPRSEYRKAPLPFAPLRISELKTTMQNALQFAAFRERPPSKSEKQDGEPLLCVGKKEDRSCFNEHGILRRMDLADLHLVTKGTQTLGEVSLPVSIELKDEKGKALSIHLESYSIDSLTATELKPAPDAVVVFDCPGVFRVPVLTEKQEPEFTQEAREKHIQGTVELAIEISPDGFTKFLGVVKSIPALDPAAVQALKTWKFKPATCDGVPVSFPAAVEVNFHFY